jgi:hypothetical protein
MPWWAYSWLRTSFCWCRAAEHHRPGPRRAAARVAQGASVRVRPGHGGRQLGGGRRQDGRHLDHHSRRLPGGLHLPLLPHGQVSCRPSRRPPGYDRGRWGSTTRWLALPRSSRNICFRENKVLQTAARNWAQLLVQRLLCVHHISTPVFAHGWVPRGRPLASWIRAVVAVLDPLLPAGCPCVLDSLLPAWYWEVGPPASPLVFS